MLCSFYTSTVSDFKIIRAYVTNHETRKTITQILTTKYFTLDIAIKIKSTALGTIKIQLNL